MEDQLDVDTAQMEANHLVMESEIDRNRRALQQLFPEAYCDGQLDLDVLLQLTGSEAQDPSERYGLAWFGKRSARQVALEPSLGTLRPAPDESVEWTSTRNLFVEGDNLEVLKLLQKSHYARVKMIYIDPPYNTGSDLIYRDNFRDGITAYRVATGQVDESGLSISSASETAGRLHTAWLNMMYPRLKLARNLLRNDGVLFMSIDEREIGNARLLLSEIFGEQNAICEFIWHAKRGGGSDKGGVVSEHEYVLCYARDASRQPLGNVQVEAASLDRVDEIGPYRRGRELNKWGANSLRRDRETMFFPIPGPNGEDVFPIRNDGKEGRWRRGHKQMMATVSRGDADFVPREDGSFTVYEKIRNTDRRAKPHRTMLGDVGQTADGTKAIKALFDQEEVFDFTKPPSLIKALIKLAAPPEPDHDGQTDFIILDFFAGSGTTAEAVMELNAEEESDLRFVLVQFPERLDFQSSKQSAAAALCEAMGRPANIAELAMERVRRAGQAIRAKHSEWAGDSGFRLLRLDSSNLQQWDSQTSDIEATLLANLDHVRPGRSANDLLFEALLRLGIDPSAHIQLRSVGGHDAYVVAEGPLIAYLGEKYENAEVDAVAQEIVELAQEISDSRDVTVILRDTAFRDDVAKANLLAALEQGSITNVKTI
ncbi:DNA methylase [Microbacterium laevaniformans]|uniref:DNA methylase n=2 Tax=Microbacterium laevaniformans TaxID=36807 RepID=A0A150HI44_9MICO|nr:DNA methylase [Microbacterium laevaniformans]